MTSLRSCECESVPLTDFASREEEATPAAAPVGYGAALDVALKSGRTLRRASLRLDQLRDYHIFRFSRFFRQVLVSVTFPLSAILVTVLYGWGTAADMRLLPSVSSRSSVLKFLGRLAMAVCMWVPFVISAVTLRATQVAPIVGLVLALFDCVVQCGSDACLRDDVRENLVEERSFHYDSVRHKSWGRRVVEGMLSGMLEEVDSAAVVSLRELEFTFESHQERSSLSNAYLFTERVLSIGMRPVSRLVLPVFPALLSVSVSWYPLWSYTSPNGGNDLIRKNVIPILAVTLQVLLFSYKAFSRLVIDVLFYWRIARIRVQLVNCLSLETPRRCSDDAPLLTADLPRVIFSHERNLLVWHSVLVTIRETGRGFLHVVCFDTLAFFAVCVLLALLLVVQNASVNRIDVPLVYFASYMFCALGVGVVCSAWLASRANLANAAASKRITDGVFNIRVQESLHQRLPRRPNLAKVVSPDFPDDAGLVKECLAAADLSDPVRIGFAGASTEMVGVVASLWASGLALIVTIMATKVNMALPF
jgi:hypothetical protein